MIHLIPLRDTSIFDLLTPYLSQEIRSAGILLFLIVTFNFVFRDLYIYKKGRNLMNDLPS